MSICKRIGLSTQELNDLTVGQVQDYMIEYVKTEQQINKAQNGESVKTRKATQADFDAF